MDNNLEGYVVVQELELTINLTLYILRRKSLVSTDTVCNKFVR